MTYLTNSKENAVQLVLSNLLPGVKVEAKRPRKDHRVLSPMHCNGRRLDSKNDVEPAAQL